MSYLYKITPDTISGNTIRSDHIVPVSPDNRIGVLAYRKYAYGDEQWGDGVQELWLHILEYQDEKGVTHQLNGWIASIHAGKKVATISEIIPAPPPPIPTSKQVTVDIEVEGYNPITLTGTLTPK